MAKKILNIATFGLAGALFGGGKKKEAPPPPPAAPTVMPAPDDLKVSQARKRAIVQRMGQRGRASTDLTGEKLGG